MSDADSLRNWSGDPKYRPYVSYETDMRGYETWRDSTSNESVKIHQLVVISNGEDPYKVFSGGDYHVHHKNKIPWDNCPDNLELLTPKEHMAKHSEEIVYERKYSNEELLDWLDSFVKEFGIVPTSGDIRGWPGPSPTTYIKHFDSWSGAIRAAGHTPRGKN